MVKVKTGVTPRNLYILAACANVAEQLGVEVVITSGTDGKHMKGSKHYTGDAVDIRSTSFGTRGKKEAFLLAVMLRLGREYQGILESLGKPNEHFHIEYDPKG